MTTTPEPTPQADRTAAIYDALVTFQNTHRLPGLQHAQIRGLLAEHLARAMSAAPPAPADRAALREQIAAAIYEHMHPGSHWSDTSMPTDWRPTYLEEADAILAVLPAATDRNATLREAVEQLEVYVGRQSSDAAPEVEGARLVIRELRRIAGQPKPVAPGKCGCYSPSGAYRCTQPEGHLGYHRHVRPDSDEWSSWVTGTAAPVPSRVADEAQQGQTCGRTKSVTGTEYPPCARPAGHREAYCRSADGKTHFLAVYGPRPVDEAQQDQTPADACAKCSHERGAHNSAGCIACPGGWRADHRFAPAAAPAVVSQPDEEAHGPRTVCVCGHTRGEHMKVGGPFGKGRLLCDACDPNSTDNLTCKEFEAL